MHFCFVFYAVRSAYFNVKIVPALALRKGRVLHNYISCPFSAKRHTNDLRATGVFRLLRATSLHTSTEQIKYQILSEHIVFRVSVT